MPIPNIPQPEIIGIDAELRLRKFDGDCDTGLPWYQDRETVLLVDGGGDPYEPERVRRMYDYLAAHGELYWIEIREGENFVPIGDVTFWQEDMPIVIGVPAYRGRGIGGRVIAALCRRAEELNYNIVYVNEIYDFNEGSRRCFARAGFVPYKKTEQGARYMLRLKEE
ncbi:MAG: GNAT family N-acetyltransferase [Oscillospiraceae bacterium]|nr:GNAT family N-acetyltransferase [Oscillospiraceae bacterium]